jgi:hypothetical protein
MLNKTMRFHLYIPIAIMVLAGCSQPETPPAIAKLEKQYPEIQKKYVYQSLIRLANVKHDPDFEKLIKDVRKIILYLPPNGDSTYQITGLPNGLRSDGYEELLNIRTAEAQRISLWVKESGEKSHYLGLVDAQDNDVIMEIDGEIHPEYLNSILGADQNSLLGFLKGGF